MCQFKRAYFSNLPLPYITIKALFSLVSCTIRTSVDTLYLSCEYSKFIIPNLHIIEIYCLPLRVTSAYCCCRNSDIFVQCFTFNYSNKTYPKDRLTVHLVTMKTRNQVDEVSIVFRWKCSCRSFRSVTVMTGISASLSLSSTF